MARAIKDVSSRGQGISVFSLKRLLMSLLTASLTLTGCSSLPESGINDLLDGCASQSKPRSDNLAAKKETTEMKGEVVVVHACLPPPREQPEKELISRALLSVVLFGKYPDETARFSVKEVILGSYEESFIELTHKGGELPAPLWRPGEYVLFFKKLERDGGQVLQSCILYLHLKNIHQG